MKKNFLKIVFIISFLPYVFILIQGIIGAFTGISFFYNTTYGFDAFVTSTLLMLYTFSFSIPIIPICLFFQVCYILRKKVGKVKSISLKKYIKICCIIGMLIIISLLMYSYSAKVERFIDKICAKQMINKCDEKIGYKKSTIITGGIFDMPEYQYNHILIDYDEPEIGLIMHSGYDSFWNTKLQETTKDSSIYQHIINDYYMQVNLPLASPGKKLISFYEEDSGTHRTKAVLLIYEDGKIYFADDIKEKDTGHSVFTALNSSEFFVGEKIKFSE
ncbi:MAG: hypothetical protein IKL55_01115 [Clostridia bacterium]|nr:hypothetical protein [Clostridia bacterium]